jgi:hypothetical protein
LMGVTSPGFLRLIVVAAAVVVKMQRQKSAVGFTQDMDDGICIRVRKSHRRAEDAKRIDRDENRSPPASKSLFQANHHVG